MKKLIRVLVIVLFTASGASVFAAHGGMSSPVGGMSSHHISGEGMRNSNGPESFDRDHGRDRATDRHSLHAYSHHHNHHHHHRHG